MGLGDIIGKFGVAINRSVLGLCLIMAFCSLMVPLYVTRLKSDSGMVKYEMIHPMGVMLTTVTYGNATKELLTSDKKKFVLPLVYFQNIKLYTALDKDLTEKVEWNIDTPLVWFVLFGIGGALFTAYGGFQKPTSDHALPMSVTGLILMFIQVVIGMILGAGITAIKTYDVTLINSSTSGRSFAPVAPLLAIVAWIFALFNVILCVLRRCFANDEGKDDAEFP